MIGELTRATGLTTGLPVAVASLVAGVSGYAIFVISARDLSLADNSRFLLYWGVLFALFGTLVGIASETTRTVFAGQRAKSQGGVKVVPAVCAMGAVLILLFAGSAALWGPYFFGEDATHLVPPILVGLAFFIAHAALVGSASGCELWSANATLTGLEAAGRLLFCLAVTGLGWGLLGFSWAVALASSISIVLCASIPRYRRLWSVRADVNWAGLARKMAAACLTAGISSLLLVGFPILLSTTTTADAFAESAPLLLALSLTRAPLLVPLGALQYVVITRVASIGYRAYIRIVSLLGTVTLIGAGVAYFAGPSVLHSINEQYSLSQATFVGLATAAGITALLTLSGAAALAYDHHSAYLAGWAIATSVSWALLALPFSVEARVLIALHLGPALGVFVHLMSLKTARRSSSVRGSPQ